MSKHILRYGTNADKKFIDGKDHFYDLLAINGNMMAYTPKALSDFIRLNQMNNQNGYFIDPITHGFQHKLSTIKSYSKKEGKETIKLSVNKLIKSYGEPLMKVIKQEERPVRAEDFDNHYESFCKNVINFQLDIVKKYAEDEGYLKYLGQDQITENLEPEFVTPPYFYLTENTYKDWLDVNIKFINEAKNQFKDNKIFAELVLSEDIFSSDKMLEDIKEKYLNAKPDGILIWIDGFKEHEVSLSQLKIFLDLIKTYSQAGIKVYNLYGSFLSIILTACKDKLGFSLDGVGHGLEYGEYRSVVPVGGGIPISRYYFRPIHKRIKYADAVNFLRNLDIIPPKPGEESQKAEEYYSKICDCNICKDIIEDNINNFSAFQNTEYYEIEIRGVKQRRNYPDRETKKSCLLHYLNNKNKEFKFAEDQSFDNILEHLNNNFNEYKDYNVIDIEDISYLKNWYQVLKDYEV